MTRSSIRFLTKHRRGLPWLLLGFLLSCQLSLATEPTRITWRQEAGKLQIVDGTTTIATYVYEDPAILRPYLAQVRGPHGTQVTRNLPPIEGRDATDHPTMHPGIWLAFADISGSDFWRNKARVVHEQFVDEPAADEKRGHFAVRNRYQSAAGDVLCRELCRISVFVRPAGYLLLWDSTFTGDREFYFGDQEEMGLGVRVAAGMSVQQGGTLSDSAGRHNEEQIWGNAADWCDYSGTVDGAYVGVTIFCHPKNIRPSIWHARDYGVVVANPFGRQVFGKGPPSKVVVLPGDSLRLRYGILLHTRASGEGLDLAAAYADYVHLAGNE